jgi:hypothetical protein
MSFNDKLGDFEVKETYRVNAKFDRAMDAEKIGARSVCTSQNRNLDEIRPYDGCPCGYKGKEAE